MRQGQPRRGVSTAALIYTLLTVAAAALLLRAARRRPGLQRRRDALRRHYVARIISALRDDDTFAAERISAPTRRRRMALAEALHTVVCHTYGADARLLRIIARQNRIDRFLMRGAALASGYRRARYLILLGSVPPTAARARRLGRYIRSRNPFVRIYALTAMLAADPAAAIRTLGEYPHTLSPFDITQITAMLRRGLLPIAFEPMLSDGNPNLRRLGLAIVRSFGIDTARKQIVRMAESDKDPVVADEALHTLAALGHDIPTERLRGRIAAFDTPRRKALCRFFAAQGYSIRTIEALFDATECECARQLIDSYKKSIVCKSPSLP